MSFHVVLPSNSLMQLFPKNSLADFRVRLSKPIILQQSYEVALEEIVYQQVQYEFLANEVHLTIYEWDEDTKLAVQKTQLPIQYSSCCGIKTLVWCINEALSDFNWMLIFNGKGYFKFVYTGGKMKYWVKLHPKLAYALGFVRAPFFKYLLGFEEKSHLPCHLLAQRTQMYVYADLVELQHVGNVMAPLLRICVTSQESAASHSERYIKPYYLPVCKNRIELIHIQVRTHTGDIFPFPTGAPLIIKLHFRPRRQ